LTREEMKEHGIKRVFMSNPDQIIGKTVAVDLKRGSTFDTKDFYAPGTGPGIADKLQPGQRAVTIEVNALAKTRGHRVPTVTTTLTSTIPTHGGRLTLITAHSARTTTRITTTTKTAAAVVLARSTKAQR